MDGKLLVISDPKIIAMPIVENDDPMIDLAHQTLISYRISDPYNNPKVRKTVYDKLVKAQLLLPKGLRFYLYEGYRSLTAQRQLFDQRVSQMKAVYPTWEYNKIFYETVKMVSPVSNLDGSLNVPPHSTGGAIDIILMDDNNKFIDMGLDLQDEKLNVLLSMTNSTLISSAAINNRAIMSRVLLQEGFINYPTEYWHWSYGDRYWAYCTNFPYAIYGPII